MSQLPFYRDRICLNVLANSHQNAIDIIEAASGHVVVGVLSADYPDIELAISDMRIYQKISQNRLSVGLGAGNPNKCHAVEAIARELKPAHINQVFSYVGNTRAAVNDDIPWINSLVSPSGKVGYVVISTGPLSSKLDKVIVPIEAAIAFIKEMGGNAIKYFPMNGLTCVEEYRAVANACAKADFALEPTGGIDLGNFKQIVSIALEAGVPKIIPHVYSSIIDNTTKDTRIEDVIQLFTDMRELVG